MKNGNLDITEKSVVTCVEWFHGYGGNALGLKRAIPGLQSVAVCERDAFVVANMVSKMEKGLLDAVPIWTDVTDFPTEPFGYQQLDFFAASYPCQPFSHAGKRGGSDDAKGRHLWPYCRKFILGARPAFVWLENVEGHVSLGLSTVLADLEEDGYTAAWGIFSASEVGAPHQRKRVFILAYDNRNGHLGWSIQNGVEGRGVSEPAQSQQPEQPMVWCKVTGCSSGQSLTGERVNAQRGIGPGGKELAQRNSIGRSHGESEIQPAEGRVNAQRDIGTGGGEDVAHFVNKGLQGHAGDGPRGDGQKREIPQSDRSVSPDGLCG